MSSVAARTAIVLAVLAVLIALLALRACGSAGDPRPRATAPPAPASPGALARQGGRLIDGGPPAFRRQIAALRGRPIVVNQWASWCGPCRFELPFFARLARRYRGRVAFLGVNAQDSRPAARRFLASMRLPFPSFFDPSTSISREFRAGFAWPTTAFYDSRGRLVRTHAGAYPSLARLERDVRRYALE